MEQALEQVGPPLVAHAEAAAAEQPGERALDHPAVSPEPLAGVDPAAGDPWGDAASAEGTAQVRGVVGLVGVQLGRALARTTRLPSWADDRRDGVDEREQLRRVVGVGRREADGQRDAVAIHHQVVLGARLAAVDRVRPVCSPPFWPGRSGIHAGPGPVDGRFIAQPVEQRLVQPLPDAGLLPVAQPPPAGRAAAAAQLLGEQPPGQPVRSTRRCRQGGTVGDAGAAALRAWVAPRAEGSDGFPEIVGDKG